MPAKKHVTINILLLLIFTDCLETFAQFCFKKSVGSADFLQISSLQEYLPFIMMVMSSGFLWTALLSVFCIFVIWSMILSKIDLSVAVPIASFSYIGIPIVSMIFLHERISALRWFGIFCILIGVILVSMSSRQKETTL